MAAEKKSSTVRKIGNAGLKTLASFGALDVYGAAEGLCEGVNAVKRVTKYQHNWVKDVDQQQPGDDIKVPEHGNKADKVVWRSLDNVHKLLQTQQIQIAVLVIGNQGTGKSSLIGLLSGQNVRTSSGDQRGTSKVTTFQSKY